MLFFFFFTQEKGGKEGGGALSLRETKEPLCSETLYTYWKLETRSLCEQDSCNCEQDNVTHHSSLLPTEKEKRPQSYHSAEVIIFMTDSCLFFGARSSNIRDKREPWSPGSFVAH